MYDSPVLWLQIKNLLSEKFCEDLIKFAERDQGANWNTVAFGTGTESQLITLNNSKMLTKLQEKMTKTAHLAKGLLNIDLDETIPTIQVTKWQPGQTHGMHHDSNMVHRLSKHDTKITVYTSLSPYGGLTMEKYGWRHCDQGDSLIFNSFYQHSVDDIRDRDRYSLIAWYYGPRWR